MGRNPATAAERSDKGTRAQAPRHPQQERGQRRVDAILDAAAEIVAAEGTAAVTMHRVARQSGTTTGSMYHFFPDREALLRALAARHAEALRVLMSGKEQDAAERWPSLSTADAVDAFVEPLLGYIDRHRDLLGVSRHVRAAAAPERRNAELDALVIRLAEALVASRDPAASGDERTSRAVAVTAIVEGMVGAMGRTVSPERGVTVAALRRALRLELRRALVAYLDSHAPRAAPRRAAPKRG